ncbi:hypothetical protein GCM10009676_31990 [Prauserella halophila]|uniref:SCP domain-containing protein n=2 Tax=Prauserella halophila TaxID=185641 RepID=A0ABN1WC34_9PSEU|nr:putative conserved protein YkwD, contains CAP (CSP/antigen 5/PR1) domain [Prauserella halophila]
MVTLSVLVGVAGAVGGHLLWPGTDASDTAQVAGPSNGLERRSPEHPPTDPADQQGGPGAEASVGPAPATSSVSLPGNEPTTTTVEPSPPATTSAPPETPDSSETSEVSTTPTTNPSTSASDTTSPTTSPATTSESRSELPAHELARYINEEREVAGCSPARVAPELDESAQAHSDDMSEHGRLSHESSDGTSFEDRVESYGYDDPAAENLAMGVTSARAVVDNWMSQDAHRANITDCDATALGVGLNEDGWYWTLDLGY